jgi:hypothetical protein
LRFTCVPARASLLGFGCREAPHCRKVVYIQLVEVEAAFKNLKDDLQLRPIYHQLEHRVEAHIFVAFLAYCLHVTLRAQLKPLAPGLTPRAVLDKLAVIQMRCRMCRHCVPLRESGRRVDQN